MKNYNCKELFSSYIHYLVFLYEQTVSEIKGISDLVIWKAISELFSKTQVQNLLLKLRRRGPLLNMLIQESSIDKTLTC